MNTLEQAKLVKNAFQEMLSAYANYEGKNLNRYKNTPEIDKLRENFNNTPPPFEFNGMFSGVVIDHQNVDLSRLRERIEEIDNIILSVNTFERLHKETYIEIEKEIKVLVERRKQIQQECKNIPSYMFKDLI